MNPRQRRLQLAKTFAKEEIESLQKKQDAHDQVTERLISELSDTGVLLEEKNAELEELKEKVEKLAAKVAQKTEQTENLKKKNEELMKKAFLDSQKGGKKTTKTTKTTKAKKAS